MISLADLAADPSLIDALDGPACGDVLIEASALVVRLGKRLASSRVIVEAPREPMVVEATDIKGASRIIGVSPSTIRRKIRVERAPEYYGLLVRTGTTRLVFSVPACRRFVARPTLGPVA